MTQAKQEQLRPGRTPLWTPRREIALRSFIFVWILVLPFGHVTGLRNTCAILAIGLALTIYKLRLLLKVPAGKWLIAYSTWCLASLIWSADRAVSWSKLQSDLIVPMLGYAASYLYVRLARKPFNLATPLLIALGGLALMSAMNWFPSLPFDRFVPETGISGAARPLPIWYPGVGDASMFATLCVGPLLHWCAVGRREVGLRCLLVLGLFTLVVEVSGNRNAFAIAPLGGGIFLIVCLLGSGIAPPAAASTKSHSNEFQKKLLSIIAVVVVAGILASTALEFASRVNMERSGKALPPWGHAAIQLIQNDARPDFWDEYRQLALRHRWRGVGFGRTVPSIAYGLRNDATFSSRDPAGKAHAHNMFLDTWLQTGYIGLMLLVSILVSLFWQLIANLRSARSEIAVIAAVMTLLVTTILHNLTDDFLVYGMADGFWVLLGMMFAFVARNISDKPLLQRETFMPRAVAS